MKIFLLTQTERKGYDTYDSCVVAAEDAEAARRIHPNGYEWDDKYYSYSYTWASSPENVSVELIGEAALGVKPGVVCASFNAG